MLPHPAFPSTSLREAEQRRSLGHPLPRGRAAIIKKNSPLFWERGNPPWRVGEGNNPRSSDPETNPSHKELHVLGETPLHLEIGSNFQAEKNRRLELARVPGLRSPPKADQHRRGAYLYHSEINPVNKKIHGPNTFVLAKCPPLLRATRSPPRPQAKHSQKQI